MNFNFLQLLALAAKYGPAIGALIQQIIADLHTKTQQGVKMTLPPDQLEARAKQLGTQVADFLYCCSCCDPNPAPSPQGQVGQAPPQP